MRLHPVICHHLDLNPLPHWSLGAMCNVRRLFSQLALLLLPSHFHLLSPRLPVQCRPVRASEETGLPHEPRTIRTNTGWAPERGAQYPTLNPPWVGPQPVVRHLPGVPALISWWCVCTPGKGNAHVSSSPWPSPTIPPTPSNLFPFQQIMTTDEKSFTKSREKNTFP